MQNNALWLETTPAGYKVRIKFSPMNEAEGKRCKALLQNVRAVVGMVVMQGPLSVDIMFTDAPESAPEAPAETAPAPVELTDEQKEALAKPDPTDKPA